MSNFELKKLKELSADSINDTKKYIAEYFIPLSTGDHAFKKNGKYEIKKQEEMSKVYINRFPKQFKSWYLCEHDNILTPVYKINKPTLYDDKLNLCSQLPAVKPYSSLPKHDRKYAEVFLGYMKEVICSNNEAIYSHLLKWTANMCKGNKNNSCLVLKTEAQGVGKSTYPQMIISHVLPKDLTIETGSQCLKSNFNSILGGKLFVSFEELETFSTGEWMAVGSKLKRQITSNMITLESKGCNPYDAENINNYCLLSNHDISDDGRRFFCLDISTHKQGDLSEANKLYWKNIYDNCFTDSVGYALYCYFREVDTTDFNPQDFPETKSKMASIAKRLNNVCKFIKYQFVLNKASIDHTVDELLEEYTCYCMSLNIRPLGKIGMNEKLKEIGINYVVKKINKKLYNKYIVSNKELLQIATKNKWIHELDEFSDGTSIDKNKKEVETSDQDNNSLLKEIESQKKQIEELQKKLEAYEKKKEKRKERKEKKLKNKEVKETESEVESLFVEIKPPKKKGKNRLEENEQKNNKEKLKQMKAVELDDDDIDDLMKMI